jgi:hypothetical protein
MTDEPQDLPAKSGKKANQTSFKPGYDPRRWLKGRGKKSPEQREGDEILRAVYWKELSREFDAATGKPLEPEETLTALELAVRNEIKKRFNNVAERIAGKVTEKVDVTTNGKDITKVIIEYVDDTTPALTPSAKVDQDPAQEV